MGMFDEIIVPKSYLRDILDKEDESLFDTYHKFQTKDLENDLSLYKVYRKQLYKSRSNRGPAKWDKMAAPHVDKIDFYDHLNDKDGSEYWFHFEFTFINNKLDSKKLVDRTVSSKESREAIDRMWDIEQDVFDEYRQKWSYKFWTRVERFCQKLSVLARKRHSIPYSLRQTAYKTSGRLEKDPDCLKIYVDN